jgi:histidinol phosphatase-like enzyme
MKIFVDIDGTIAFTEGADYPNARPNNVVIEKINKLYIKGHEIIYWTARGATSGIDWTELTEKQLEEWGVKYHKIQMGKPRYDVFICDKALNVKDI